MKLERLELEKRLEKAKADYLAGDSWEGCAQKNEVSKWTVYDRVYKGTRMDKAWVVQRREFRDSVKKEAAELAKVNISLAFRHGADLLFKCFKSLEHQVDNGALKTQEVISLMRTLFTGLPDAYKLFMPSMKQPMVNIAINNEPRLSEADVITDLAAKGLYIEEEAEVEDNVEKS